MKEEKKKYGTLNVTEKAKLVNTIVNNIQKYAYLGETVKNLLEKQGIICVECGKKVEIPYDLAFSSGKGKVMVFIVCKDCKKKKEKK